MRLGVYSDARYWSDGRSISTRQAFIPFIAQMPPRVDEVVFFGRLDTVAGRSDYELPSRGVRFVPLPHYATIRDVAGQVRAAVRTASIFADELDRLDAVWIFGPHPMSLVLARAAHRRKTPVFLGVRQDYPSYIAHRLPSRAWLWAVPIAHALERAFRSLARTTPTLVMGDALARTYRRGSAPVLSTGFCLVPRSELAERDEAVSRQWDRDRRILSVSRLDPEKNPLLLPEIVSRLRAVDPRWRLAIAGDGPLRAELERRIAELGVSEAVELLGLVPNGPELWREYRTSHAFLHVSLTEGFPQVLLEAQAAGLPIVATDVGGVRAALEDGALGLLIPPEDPDAAASALQSLTDPSLRAGLISAGLASAENETMEAQLDRIAAFFHANA